MAQSADGARSNIELVRPSPDTGRSAGAGRATEELWARLGEPDASGAFVAAWLGLQCQKIKGARSALVLVEDAESHTLAPLATWPPGRTDFNHFKTLAERAMRERAGVIEREEAGDTTRAAYPIEGRGHVSALVLLEMTGTAGEVQDAMRDLHWGAGWLETVVLRLSAEESRGRLERAGTALEILAIASDHDTLEASAMAVVNELAVRLGCDRVALSVAPRGGRPRLLALSDTAWFRKKSQIVGAIETAMEEAFDQGETVAFPPIEGLPRSITVAHQALAERAGAASIVSVVLPRRGGSAGVLTLERRSGQPFDVDTVRGLEAVAALLGPTVELVRRQRRWIAGRLVDEVERNVRKLTGPRHPTFKIGCVALIALLAALALWPASFRVSARGVLEGSEQRAAAAPFQGFVATAKARAGDIVKAGDVLLELDEKDIRLELARWRAEYARFLQEKRKAIAAMDRTEAALVDAQIEQSRAQIELTTSKLTRTRITAPIDGVVVSGDWSQKLGAPVEQGTVLFEISPLESYRAILKVEEGDVGHVRTGQKGTLLLAGRADAAVPFEVTRVTSVAAVEDGQNVFRIEAALAGGTIGIRPGMEGVGKIDIDRRAIGWVWSRRLIDWLRLFVWRNTP